MGYRHHYYSCLKGLVLELNSIKYPFKSQLCSLDNKSKVEQLLVCSSPITMRAYPNRRVNKCLKKKNRFPLFDFLPLDFIQALSDFHCFRLFCFCLFRLLGFQFSGLLRSFSFRAFSFSIQPFSFSAFSIIDLTAFRLQSFSLKAFRLYQS